MATCECGCGDEAQGQFITGHDQRLRIALETEVGGVLPLRTIVRAARAYADGDITDQAFTQTVRGVFAGRPPGPPSDKAKTCRDEILECARQVLRQSKRHTFTIPEIIECMQNRHTRYPETTIRTHIVSRMCANAPENHAVTYRDLERVERGEYKLID